MFETFYKLRVNPFRLTPDARFCFRHPSYNQANAYLQYALKMGEGFIMVTGRPGIGKTTLAEVFLTEIEHSEVVAARVASANVEAADLLRVVAYAYGMDVAGLDKATVLLRLEQFFVRQTQSGRRVLLIIDEAQALPQTALEELRLLADMQKDSRPLLQLFLVGQEKLRSLMREPDMEQFQQRVIGACHLEPMDLLATHAYMEHRLRTAGWTGDPQLTGAAVLAVYQYTQGVPRHVNKLCTRLLLHGMLNEKHELHKADVLSVAADLRAEQLAPMGGDETPAADAQETKALPQQLSLADLVLRMDPQEAEQRRRAHRPSEPERSGAPNRREDSRAARDSEQNAAGYDSRERAARQHSPLVPARVTGHSGIGRRGAEHSPTRRPRAGIGEFREPPGGNTGQRRQAAPRGPAATRRQARRGRRADAGKWGPETLVRHRSHAISSQYLRKTARLFSRLKWQGKLPVFVAALLVANLIAAIVLTQLNDTSDRQPLLAGYSGPAPEAESRDQRQDLIVGSEAQKPRVTVNGDPARRAESAQGAVGDPAQRQPDRGEDEWFASLVDHWDTDRVIGRPSKRALERTTFETGVDEHSAQQPAVRVPETELAAVAVESVVVPNSARQGEPDLQRIQARLVPADVPTQAAAQPSEDRTTTDEVELSLAVGSDDDAITVAKLTGALDAAESVATPSVSEDEPPVPAREQAIAPSISTKQKIAELIGRGQNALKRDRLLVPPDDNAYTYYQQVLTLDPGNEEALFGIERIVARYAILTRKAIARQDRVKGELYVNRGLSINPADRRLLALRDSLRASVVEVEPAVQPPIAQVKEPPPPAAEVEPAPASFFSRLKAFFSKGRPAAREGVPVEER